MFQKFEKGLQIRYFIEITDKFSVQTIKKFANRIVI